MTESNEQKPAKRIYPDIDAIHTADYAKMAEKLLGDIQASEAPDPLKSILAYEKITDFEGLKGKVAESIEIAREIFEPILLEQLGSVDMTIPTMEQLLARDDLDWASFEKAYTDCEELGNEPVILMVPTKFDLAQWRDCFSGQGAVWFDLAMSQDGPESTRTNGAILDSKSTICQRDWICSIYPKQAQSRRTAITHPRGREALSLPIYPEYLTAELYHKHIAGSFEQEEARVALKTEEPAIEQGLYVATRHTSGGRTKFNIGFHYYSSKNGPVVGSIIVAETHRTVRLESLSGGQNG